MRAGRGVLFSLGCVLHSHFSFSLSRSVWVLTSLVQNLSFLEGELGPHIPPRLDGSGRTLTRENGRRQGTYGRRSNGHLMCICWHEQRACSLLSRPLLAARIDLALLTLSWFLLVCSVWVWVHLYFCLLICLAFADDQGRLHRAHLGWCSPLPRMLICLVLHVPTTP